MIHISDHQIELLQESKRRSQHKIHTYVPSDLPDHNQLSYHKSTAIIRLLFGGNQSGKSRAAAQDCACNARGKNPYNSTITGRDVEIWCISAEYSTLRTGIYRHLKDIIPDWDLVQEGPRVQGHNLPTFLKVRRADGYHTTITFLSAKGDAREKFQAAAVDYFYIDEEIQADIWSELEARTIVTGGTFSISATLVESYEWILALETRAERGDNTVFLTRLNTESNVYADSERIALLKDRWDEETKQYRLYGKAKRHTGIIYNNWDSLRHTMEGFTIPLTWPRYRSIDPGIRTCAVLWIAVDEQNHAYGYRELYAHNEPLWQVAIIIKQLEGYRLNQDLSHKFNHYVWDETEKSEQMISSVIDPKSKARSEAGEVSILDQLYTRYGMVCSPADNALRPGIEDCRFWLENIKTGLPGFRVFNNLYNFIDEVKAYRFRPKATKRPDQSEPIDEPIRKKNHLMDCWRYTAREKPSWSDRLRLADEFGAKPYIPTYERIANNIESKQYVHPELGVNW